MNLSIRRIGNQNLYYHESDVESSIQLVFTPGAFNHELWKHQLRYFSKKYKTIVFEPMESNKSLHGEKKALKNVLDSRDIDNAVLISNIVGNQLIQCFEDRDNVTATFMTGSPQMRNLPPCSFYRLFWALNLRKPKLLRKTFFSQYTDYKVLKDFVEDAKPPSYKEIKGFTQAYGLRRPFKPSTTVYAEDDRLSSLESVRSIQEDRSISFIERAGTFSFYEKPQEYNKVLNDFLTKVGERVRDREVVETQKKHRSLFEFENKKQGQKEKVKVRK